VRHKLLIDANRVRQALQREEEQLAVVAEQLVLIAAAGERSARAIITPRPVWA
jgi:hypothetical protein